MRINYNVKIKEDGWKERKLSSSLFSHFYHAKEMTMEIYQCQQRKKKGKVLNNNAWASFKILTLFYFLLENFGKKTLFFEEEFHHFQKKKNSFEQEKFVMRNNFSFSLKRKDLQKMSQIFILGNLKIQRGDLQFKKKKFTLAKTLV